MDGSCGRDAERFKAPARRAEFRFAEDHYVQMVRKKWGETKSNLEAVEGRIRWGDDNDARIFFFKKEIAIYEAILARAGTSLAP
jgi:hypothetical protein